jgi:hypothetical protein
MHWRCCWQAPLDELQMLEQRLGARRVIGVGVRIMDVGHESELRRPSGFNGCIHRDEEGECGREKGKKASGAFHLGI